MTLPTICELRQFRHVRLLILASQRGKGESLLTGKIRPPPSLESRVIHYGLAVRCRGERRPRSRSRVRVELASVVIVGNGVRVRVRGGRGGKERERAWGRGGK